ncbi:MAG: N(5)-(carboxyethyl)ornithine synthase [Lewinella sp.]|nr:N(5)-(carboxyethyl)ornithine synthase [Lewinella sp.]
MALLSVGVFGSSHKAHEMRVPIHPEQLEWIAPDARQKIYLEKGYGERFGLSDAQLAEHVAGILPREQLFAQCDIALIPKPVAKDLQAMRPGTILWGWPHCVQQQDITQTAIDRKLTLIAFEAMHKWGSAGDWQMHIFARNNEIAGYAGILHAMNLLGIDGTYGPRRKAAVISFGSVSRGAITALQARGVQDISVFTHRRAIFVADRKPGIEHFRFEEGDDGRLIVHYPDRDQRPLIEELAEADIIVNGTLQDTDSPLMFVHDDEMDRLKHGCLIADISCDEGMGFSFARPTTFDEPMFEVGPVHYYAVDHTPSYLWNAASWEISSALVPYMPVVMQGPERWAESETLTRAIEIRDGVIENPKILSFQGREEAYPHAVVKDHIAT